MMRNDRIDMNDHNSSDGEFQISGLFDNRDLFWHDGDVQIFRSQ